MTLARIFQVGQPTSRRAGWADVIIVLGLFAVIYGGVRLALRAPAEIQGPTISLAPSALPRYAAFSVGRMAAAYALSLIFSLVYGHAAAHNPLAERILMPLLDILQSVPILSFLPVVLLGLSAVLPQGVAAELASIVLIFTSQAWNITFAWYQSLTTMPKELREASSIFRLNSWLHFKTLALPFGAISLIWNSMMSWAGGWFFLMAAETFTVGQRDFRLPGLGSYLKTAASEGNLQAIAWGVGTLVLVVVILDQLVWRPLLAWSERFKLEMVEGDNPPTSWFYDLLSQSRLIDWLGEHVSRPLGEAIDRLLGRLFSSSPNAGASNGQRRSWIVYVAGALIVLAVLYAAYRGGQMLITVPLAHWGAVGLGVLGTLARVSFALIVALAWTIPVGVLIGTNPRLAAVLQPLVQITASVPATALFPVLLLVVLQLPGGLNIAAVLLMLMGTQWYLLFNVIAGATAIPQDLKYTATLMGLNKWERWRTLILPALFPYIVTGAITASGGAWNASIVAEYVDFGGQTLQTVGIGALIARATEGGDYSLLLAATLSMILTVVLINRLLWRRLYRLAEEQYRME
jgi:NitT/TauT family transport system permease protein